MAQLALFESGPRLLVDDPTGRIEYTPDFVDSKTAARWFDALREVVPWRGERRRMYDRDVDVPRQHAAYRLDSESLPDALGEAAGRVRSALAVPFNGAGLNLYRDG